MTHAACRALLVACACSLVAFPASARPVSAIAFDADGSAYSAGQVEPPAAALFIPTPAPGDILAVSVDLATQDPNPQPLHAAAVTYSDAYQTRRKIHKYASFATLPLFAAEFALGQSMYNTTPGDSNSRRGVHAALGFGIIGLFGVNTVTGAWNLFGEGWQNRDGRTLRLIHGLLMMAADAGFVASAQSGPNSRSFRHALTFETDKVTHRNIAVASMSVATASYLLMLFGNH